MYEAFYGKYNGIYRASIVPRPHPLAERRAQGGHETNIAHAQAVCTWPLLRGEGPGDEATNE